MITDHLAAVTRKLAVCVDPVSAQFPHSALAPAGAREQILRRAALAVAPGGVLLIVGHAEWPSWVLHPSHEFHFPTTSEVLDSLALEPQRWHVQLRERVDSELTGPAGQQGRRGDNVLRIRRLG